MGFVIEEYTTLAMLHVEFWLSLLEGVAAKYPDAVHERLDQTHVCLKFPARFGYDYAYVGTDCDGLFSVTYLRDLAPGAPQPIYGPVPIASLLWRSLSDLAAEILEALRKVRQ